MPCLEIYDYSDFQKVTFGKGKLFQFSTFVKTRGLIWSFISYRVINVAF